MYVWNPIIVSHAIAATGAALAGILIFASKKGTVNHKLIGRAFVLLMLFTAVSSFWITNEGRFSWIHLLSIFTPFMLAKAIWHIRKGETRHHQRTMLGVFFGAIGIAGLFTLAPSRLIGNALWKGVGLI